MHTTDDMKWVVADGLVSAGVAVAGAGPAAGSSADADGDRVSCVCRPDGTKSGVCQ
jgi:hypothetical protein